MTMDRQLEALLGELRIVHEPTAVDRRRVRAALGDAVVREQLAKPANGASEPGRGEYLRLVLGSGGSTMVGVMTLAAAAAAAVVTLAHPGSKLAQRLTSGSATIEVKREPQVLAQAGESASSSRHGVFATDGTGEVEAGPVQARGCGAWPCLEAESRRALTLGGAPLGEPASVGAARNEEPASEMATNARAGDSEGRFEHRLEVSPVVAVDIAPGRVTPGAGVRVAVPVTKKQDVALEVTLQHFPVQGADGLLAGGMGICWRPIGGRWEASLCGRMGYESGTTRPSAEVNDDAWRLTAGASAELVWNLTRDLGAYAALEGAMPVATSAGAGRALGMRVMAGPRLSF